MRKPERERNVLDLLRGFRGIEPLKKLFWSELNYQRVNQPLSRRGWTESASKVLADDPVLFAGGGEDNAFHVIYCRLASDALPRGFERPVVTQLLREHPYALFVFSSKDQTNWHFLNVKYDDQTELRRLFRRITVRPGAGLRTAMERIQLLDLAEINPELFGITPLAIQERCDAAFDVETVTKDFFREIANWYFWALKNVCFPKDAPKEADGHDHISVIRLITRLIFCWFVKEKGLIPDTLFDDRTLAQTLTGFEPTTTSDKESVFYKAILQNLFFATLNTEMDKRAWRKDDNNFMAHILYRHRTLFQKPNEALDFFKSIPFLNGGLFECLDKREGTKESPKDIRIDGFSDRRDSQPIVPDFLFFGGEREVDLSADYGDPKFRRVPVRGLIHIFNRYNFTVEENTPIEQEVALDPELSGKVFENLLAAYNPETGATARKQTGSFYTPREVVNFMVDEALIAYLRIKLEAALPSAKNVVTRLRHLFTYNDEPHKFAALEVDALIAAIDGLKSIDPAVGSGAFPMGILHKLVFILGRLDPRNEKWKERQISRVRDTMATAEKIEDATARERAVRELEQQITGINEAFEHNELDYGRKLYLIENCIYGVDVQPIAVQIAKMRFFISLIVDQKIDDSQPNRGVRPLPNLETKFVAANTLIDVNRPGQQLLRNREIEAKEVELGRVRERHFLARTPKQKAKCRDDDARLRSEIAELLKDDGWDTATARKLASWNPYDQNASADFYDSEWMFGIQDGFDIVIANPPYLKERDNKHVFAPVKAASLGKLYHEGKMDFWYYFLHRAIAISKERTGLICFITSRYWINSQGAKKLIRRVKEELNFLAVVDIGDLKVFEAVAGHHMVALYGKQRYSDEIPLIRLREDVAYLANPEPSEFVEHEVLRNESVISDEYEIVLSTSRVAVTGCTRLGELCEISQGVVEAPDKITKKQIAQSGRDDLAVGTGVFVLSEEEVEQLNLSPAERSILKPYLDPHDVGRYWIAPTDRKFLIYSDRENKALIKTNPQFKTLKKHLDRFSDVITSSNAPYGLHRPREKKFFQSPKILFPSMFSDTCFALDTNKFYVGMSFSVVIAKDGEIDLRFILALLNSHWALKWYYSNGKHRGAGVDIGVEKLRTFPVPASDATQQATITGLVDRIFAAKRRDDLVVDTSALEREIDQQVYALYGVTWKETEKIQGKSHDTKSIA